MKYWCSAISEFGDLHKLIGANAHDEEESINAYRHAVNAIDDAVEALVKVITALNKIPIAIGGGHNNVLPDVERHSQRDCTRQASSSWRESTV